MTSEDQRFNEHFGLDMEAIQKAVHTMKNIKKQKRGASTISQQTAKNVFLSPHAHGCAKGLKFILLF